MTSIEHLLLFLLLLFYFAASVLYFLAARRPAWAKYAFWSTAAGLLCNVIVLVYHVSYSKRLPLSNGYEFLLSFACITAFMYLFYEIKRRSYSAGGVIMLVNVLLTAAILILMPQQIGASGPLMPALKSPWLTVHVLTAIAAYSAFTVAAGLAAVKLKINDLSEDTDIYQITSFGFVMLTLSIILGAIWAEQVWGRYWTWDPKETWALVTWIIYAIYLHLHRQRDWRGNHARILVIAGFILVLFTFFGVNYLLPGLHSYA